jgi:4-aminobutyrate aminotransferase-like enzyme
MRVRGRPLSLRIANGHFNGLFQGIEFVMKRTELSGKVIILHEKLCRYVVDFLKYERIIVSRDGPDGIVIKIKPPLVFTKGNFDTLANRMKWALFEAKKRGYFNLGRMANLK